MPLGGTQNRACARELIDQGRERWEVGVVFHDAASQWRSYSNFLEYRPSLRGHGRRVAIDQHTVYPAAAGEVNLYDTVERHLLEEVERIESVIRCVDRQVGYI